MGQPGPVIVIMASVDCGDAMPVAHAERHIRQLYFDLLAGAINQKEAMMRRVAACHFRRMNVATLRSHITTSSRRVDLCRRPRLRSVNDARARVDIEIGGRFDSCRARFAHVVQFLFLRSI